MKKKICLAILSFIVTVTSGTVFAFHQPWAFFSPSPASDRLAVSSVGGLEPGTYINENFDDLSGWTANPEEPTALSAKDGTLRLTCGTAADKITKNDFSASGEQLTLEMEFTLGSKDGDKGGNYGTWFSVKNLFEFFCVNNGATMRINGASGETITYLIKESASVSNGATGNMACGQTYHVTAQINTKTRRLTLEIHDVGGNLVKPYAYKHGGGDITDYTEDDAYLTGNGAADTPVNSVTYQSVKSAFLFSELSVDYLRLYEPVQDVKPSADNVQISLESGKLAANYEYSDNGSGIGQGDTRFLWEKSANATGPWEKLAESSPFYTPSVEEEGSYFRVTVTPVDADGIAGEPAVSPAFLYKISHLRPGYYIDETFTDLSAWKSEPETLTAIRAAEDMLCLPSGIADETVVHSGFSALGNALTCEMLFTVGEKTGASGSAYGNWFSLGDLFQFTFVNNGGDLRVFGADGERVDYQIKDTASITDGQANRMAFGQTYLFSASIDTQTRRCTINFYDKDGNWVKPYSYTHSGTTNTAYTEQDKYLIGGGNPDAPIASASFKSLKAALLMSDIAVDTLLLYEALPPSAANLEILRDAVGLSASYDYEGVAAEGNSQFIWERSPDGKEPWTTLTTTAKTYLPSASDVGSYLRVTVIPADKNGTLGAAVTSAPLQISEDMVPKEVAFYVSQTGNDANPGTSKEQAFATIQRAKEAVRTVRGGSLPVTVYLCEGEYTLLESLQFTAEDAGLETAPITYRNYPGEKVTLTGATRIDTTKAKQVTDESILQRVISLPAREHLMVLDLGAQGITNIQPMIEGVGNRYKNSDYHPVEFYLDEIPLTAARWPNDGFVALNLVECEQDDYKNKPITLGFEDANDRTSLWSEAGISDLFIGTRASFSYQTNKVASLDKAGKKLTTAGGAQYKPDIKSALIHFFNILEEIDMPGEYYLDRAENLLYYYPVSQKENPELMIASADTPMIRLNNTEYLTFQGINFQMNRGRFVDASSIRNVTIDNCVFAHGGTNAITWKAAKDCALTNSHIYDMAAGGIFVTNSGNRKTLEPANVTIRNNHLHSNDRVFAAYVPSVLVAESAGVAIEENKIYDAKQTAVLLEYGNNDIQLNYNEIHHAATMTNDMAGIYWGRDASCLGIEVKYNYFHDNGNPLGGDFGSHSIFWDDGAAGPYLYGNIFYRGANPTEKGGKPNDGAIKTYYGQKGVIENNIIVDSPSAFTISYNGSALRNWVMWLYGIEGFAQGDLWSKLEAVEYDSEIWQERYKDTPWSWLNTYYKREFKQALDTIRAKYETPSNSKDDPFQQEIEAFIQEHIYPSEQSSLFRKNVLAKVDVPVNSSWKPLTGPGGIVTSELNHAITSSEVQTSFVEYGADFQLTESALQKVRETIPDFENIQTDQIGLKPVSFDGNQRFIGGRAPSVTEVRVSGEAVNGKTAYTAYNFTDPDDDEEGLSKIQWYLSDTPDGVFEKLENETAPELFIKEAYSNKYIRFSITPVDSRMVPGETVLSNVIHVTEQKADPAETVKNAEEMLQSVTVGTALGQIAQTDKQALQETVTQTKEVMQNPDATNADLQTAIQQLEAAIQAFRGKIVNKASVTEPNTVLDIPVFSETVSITIQDGVSGTKARLKIGEELPEITIAGFVPIDGLSRQVRLTIPKGTKITGQNWDGFISLFTVSTNEPVSNASHVNAITLADGISLSFTNAARLQISDTANKEYGAISNGKFTQSSKTVAEDTVEAANRTLKNSRLPGRVKTSPDMILWTTVWESLVLYEKEKNDTPINPPVPTPNYQNGGGAANSTGPGNPVGIMPLPSPSPSGSRFKDTAGHWAQSDIEAMADLGVVSGVTTDTFEPDRSITRAEFATLVTKTLGLTWDNPSHFEDVSAGAWYFNAVNAAAEAGLIVGYDGYFHPDDRITREEMSVILAKAYDNLGLAEGTADGIAQFRDQDKIAGWAVPYVDSLVRATLIYGKDNNAFDPQGYTTRAEAASILKRLLDLL